MSSEASMLLLPDQTNAAGFISKNINSCFFMGQCSKLLLSHLIGKAERSSTHTQDMDEKTRAHSVPPSAREGHGYSLSRYSGSSIQVPAIS